MMMPPMAENTKETVGLSDNEKLALCGLARALLQSHAGVSADEQAALEDVLQEVFAPTAIMTPGETAYRASPQVETPTVDVGAWLERAARELPDDDAVRAAAQRVMRPESRELICDALFSLAATDTVSESEWKVLDWLTDTWKMPRMRG
jgi:hypothetical protein